MFEKSVCGEEVNLLLCRDSFILKVPFLFCRCMFWIFLSRPVSLCLHVHCCENLHLRPAARQVHTSRKRIIKVKRSQFGMNPRDGKLRVSTTTLNETGHSGRFPSALLMWRRSGLGPRVSRSRCGRRGDKLSNITHDADEF